MLLTDHAPFLNGYSTVFPSRRIVIMANPADPTGIIASFSDELRSVLRHELVHALTSGMRSPFWAFAASIFGDPVSPASWIMPAALVEGTAVYAESLDGEGRLNDPAALEAVFGDLANDRFGGVWDVSGGRQGPGTGSLPYLYGGLFAAGLGEDRLAALWKEAAEGKVLEGFDGTFLPGGALGSVTGIDPAATWDGFRSSLGPAGGAPPSRAALPEAGTPAETSSPAGTAGLPGTASSTVIATGIASRSGKARVIAVAAYGNTIYWVDAEQGSAFALEIGGGGKARRLFGADGWVESLATSPDGKHLYLDCLAAGDAGEYQRIRRTWDIEGGNFTSWTPRGYAPMGDGARALEGAIGGPALPPDAAGASGTAQQAPFLWYPVRGPDGAFEYGLAKVGSIVLPARRDTAAGTMLVLSSPLESVRSLSMECGEEPKSSPAIALSFTPREGLSRLALLYDGPEGPRLNRQDADVTGGVHRPVFTPSGIVHTGTFPEGELLRLFPGSMELVETGARWMTIEDWAGTWKGGQPARAARQPAATDRDAAAASQGAVERAVLPLISRTCMVPYADLSRAGLSLLASDITDRASWTASAGWNRVSASPEFALETRFALGWWDIGLALADSVPDPLAGGPSARASSATLAVSYRKPILPLYRTVGFDALAVVAGIDPAMPYGGWFSSAWSAFRGAGRAGIRMGTLRKSAFPPFDLRGGEVLAGASLEYIPGGGAALSVHGSMEAGLPSAGLRLSVSGAWSADPRLGFGTRGRVLAGPGGPEYSILEPESGPYREYESLAGTGGWYASGEVGFRIASIPILKRIGEASGGIMLPVYARRVDLHAGLRAALFAPGGSILFPASAFARASLDLSPLFGLSATGTVALDAEAAWAFSPGLAGGKPLSFNFTLGISM